MSQAANVRSVDALKDVKLSLITFSEEARATLTTVDMEVRRTRDWLEQQLTYWKNQVKRREQDVAQARSDLHRRRLAASNSDSMSDTEQKEALRLAQRRQAEAEDKVARVKRWIPIFEHASAEYRAHSQPLGDHLAGSHENTLVALDRMVGALEAYIALNAPSAPRYVPPRSGADEAPAATTSATAATTSAAAGTESAGAAAESKPAEGAPQAEEAAAGAARSEQAS